MLKNNLSVKYIERRNAIPNNTNPADWSKFIYKNKLPKIVGDIRHYPPANKEWKNSIYAYNKNSLKSLPALDKMASKTIKSYFNLSNNKKLARSERMRNLIRRRTVKRLFVSRPEIKQTSDKVNITVYTFNREKQFFLRKMYFYDRNMYINKNIYLYKLWLKKNLLAFKKTFKDRKSIKLLKRNKKIKTVRKNINKTYLHNILLKRFNLRKISKKLKQKKQISVSKKSKQKKQISVSKRLRRIPTLMRKMRKNLVKSLQNRNLIRLLKKREKKKRTSVLNLGMIPSILTLKNSYLVSNNYIKTFNNYLIKKISRKIKFKLRNFNSIVKIKQKRRNQKRSRFKKIRLPYSNLRFKNEIKFFSFKLVSEIKYIRKLFQFYFIHYLFHSLQTKLNSNNSDIRYKNQKSKFYLAFVKADEFKTLAPIVSNNKNLFNYLKDKFKKNIKKSKNEKVNIIRFKNKYSYDKLRNIDLLNLDLLSFLKRVSNNLKYEKFKGKDLKKSLSTLFFYKENIDLLYKKFEDKYFLRFLARFFKKEFLYINYYSKFLINQLKYGKFLPGLKVLISKIYSKKVELNLVNLKYPHLNSDIYTDSIATKLKKKIGLLRVLKWSLNLARLPYKYLSYNNTANLNKLQSLNIHKSLDINALNEEKNKFGLNSFEDRLHGVLNKLYPYSLVHNFSRQTGGQSPREQLNSTSLNSPRLVKNKEKLAQNPILSKNLSVLNIIKYKWVSGVRLEAAGRLTRRYTAARSVFKFRYKGSLKNIDYSQKTDLSKKNISTVMLRNHVKSNSQYSFTKSKRRIGAFGLKAWIASY